MDSTSELTNILELLQDCNPFLHHVPLLRCKSNVMEGWESGEADQGFLHIQAGFHAHPMAVSAGAHRSDELAVCDVELAAFIPQSLFSFG